MSSLLPSRQPGAAAAAVAARPRPPPPPRKTRRPRPPRMRASAGGNRSTAKHRQCLPESEYIYKNEPKQKPSSVRGFVVPAAPVVVVLLVVVVVLPLGVVVLLPRLLLVFLLQVGGWMRCLSAPLQSAFREPSPEPEARLCLFFPSKQLVCFPLLRLRVRAVRRALRRRAGIMAGCQLVTTCGTEQPRCAAWQITGYTHAFGSLLLRVLCGRRVVQGGARRSIASGKW